MKVGDIVSNPIRVGVKSSIREVDHARGLIVGVEEVMLRGIGFLRTDITVLLNDGAMHKYDSAGFEVKSSPLK